MTPSESLYLSHATMEQRNPVAEFRLRDEYASIRYWLHEGGERVQLGQVCYDSASMVTVRLWMELSECDAAHLQSLGEDVRGAGYCHGSHSQHGDIGLSQQPVCRDAIIPPTGIAIVCRNVSLYSCAPGDWSSTARLAQGRRRESGASVQKVWERNS